MQGKDDSSTPNNDKPLEAFEKFPGMEAGFSYKGKETVNQPLQHIEHNIPHGYKRITLFSPELQSCCIAIVPEDTPELTQEEYERYSHLNSI